jgi:hypothetical protein
MAGFVFPEIRIGVCTELTCIYECFHGNVEQEAHQFRALIEYSTGNIFSFTICAGL